MFSSLKHPIRRKILRILAANPRTFTEILEQINIESAHLSYHLENLGELTKKTNEGKYSLSDFGQAAVSLMARVEEPEKLVTPVILRTPRRLNMVRVFSFTTIMIGVFLLVNGILALPSVDYRMTRVQKNTDTDYWVFQPGNLSGFGGYYYQGDGLYGIEIDFQLRDAFSTFPLIVRLCTPKTGEEVHDYWNQSWYEWDRPSLPSVSDIHERLSVTLFVSGNSVQIVSQDSFDHVHPSPGKIIGEFRPTSTAVLFKVAPDVGNRNVTLSGFRAFQIKWFYFPQPQSSGKSAFVLSGLGLIIPSAVFILTSRNMQRRKGNV